MSQEEGGPTPAVETPADPTDELRDLVLAEQAELEEDTHKVLPVPGRPSLRVRYHREISFKLIEKAQKSLARGKSGMLDVLLDLMIAACDELLVERKNGDLVPLSHVFPELGEGPARFTPAVAAVFKKPEAESARESVLAVFRSEPSILPHARQLDAWLSYSETPEVDDDDEELADDF